MTITALYLILLTNGVTAGVWGPLPYPIEECQDKIEQVQLELQAYSDIDIPDMECKYYDKKPKMGL